MRRSVTKRVTAIYPVIENFTQQDPPSAASIPGRCEDWHTATGQNSHQNLLPTDQYELLTSLHVPPSVMIMKKWSRWGRQISIWPGRKQKQARQANKQGGALLFFFYVFFHLTCEENVRKQETHEVCQSILRIQCLFSQLFKCQTNKKFIFCLYIYIHGALQQQQGESYSNFFSLYLKLVSVQKSFVVLAALDRSQKLI